MGAMNIDSLLDAAMWRAGLADRASAILAAEATLEALGECLPAVDAHDLAAALPPALSGAVQRTGRHGAMTAEQLFERVSRQEEVRLGLAVEHAEAVCEALAEQLEPELRTRLQLHLPGQLAALFSPRRFENADPPPHQPGSGRGHTLASGRPGSAHPLSEAAPPGAQHDSVVATENPHSDSKLSSGHAPAGAETLATGHPGSSAPLAEAADERKDR